MVVGVLTVVVIVLVAVVVTVVVGVVIAEQFSNPPNTCWSNNTLIE